MRTLTSLCAGLVALGLLAACDSSEPMAPAELPVHFTDVPPECPPTFDRVRLPFSPHPVDRNGDGVICRKSLGGPANERRPALVVEVDNIIAGPPKQY